MRPKDLGRAFAVAALLAAMLGDGGCRDKRAGAVRVLVIGTQPHLQDASSGALATPDKVLLMNVAQGLVRFDAAGNIVGGLAERWNVSDDGLSYIFRLASVEWPDGTRITAQQVARILKRQLARHSKNPLKDALGAIEDVVAMTDRVIEIRLVAPRPDLLPLLAQPEFGISRNGHGTGPFSYSTAATPGELRLVSEVLSTDDEVTRREEVLLDGKTAEAAVRAFSAGSADMVLGGTFADLPIARRPKLPRNSLRFDPASGLFGLIPVRADGPLTEPYARRLLSQAIDRDALVQSFSVPGLAARATILEPGLDGIPIPVQPAWAATPIDQRRAALTAEARRLFGGHERPMLRVSLPAGPGSEILLARLRNDWGLLGINVQRAASTRAADLALVDLVAPSTSPAWFLRAFRCEAVPVCDEEADTLMGSARDTGVPAQRYAFLMQAAARLDDAQVFIPLAAPVRWSLVSGRIQGFAGNRYALHTLTDLEQKPAFGAQ